MYAHNEAGPRAIKKNFKKDRIWNQEDSKTDQNKLIGTPSKEAGGH